jgi:hypothetical protein
MLALKKARQRIEKQPDSAAAKTLSALVMALETDKPFALGGLYLLNYDDLGLALELMAEWRLDRYYASKGRLLDLSVQVKEMPAADDGESKMAERSGKAA